MKGQIGQFKWHIALVLVIGLLLGYTITTGFTTIGLAKGGNPGKPVGGDDPMCSDGIDNDDDGLCDFRGCYEGKGRNKVWLEMDPDCTSDNDESESCEPSPEICDGIDNNCNGEIDEGVLNNCGECGPEPTEVCDGIDNDCDGLTDEGVTNACGECGPVPPEICDGTDNDCDGETDEGSVCIPNSCIDTDGGKVADVQGTITGFIFGEEFSKTDMCNSTAYMTEYYCASGVYPAEKYVDCSINWTSCSNGACV